MLEVRENSNFYLHAEEGANNVDRSLIVMRPWPVFRQFDIAAGHTLQLSDVLAPFADDATNLRTRYENLDGQSDVVRAGDEAFFAHLFKNQVLGLQNLENFSNRVEFYVKHFRGYRTPRIYLPLRLRWPDDGNTTFGLLAVPAIISLFGVERGDFDCCPRKTDHVPDVWAFRADDSANRIIWDVQVRCFLKEDIILGVGLGFVCDNKPQICTYFFQICSYFGTSNRIRHIKRFTSVGICL